MGSKHDEDLIHALYGAVLDPAGWHGALHALMRRADADNYHLMVWEHGAASPAYSLAWGITERMEHDYRMHYGAIDPRRLIVAGMPEGQWLACHERFDDRSVARSEFFQDHLIPGQLRYLIGTRLTRRDSRDVFFGLHRAVGRAPFDGEAAALVRRLTGHFQQAAQLWLATEELRRQALLGQHALNAIELGVLAVDAQARVVLANRYAEAILRDGAPLLLRQRRLGASDHADELALAAALRECLSTRQPRSVRLGASDPAVGFCGVTVLRLPADGGPWGHLGPAELLVLVGHGRRRRALTVQQLMQLFGLTPAEARLARALAGGESVAAYTREAGVRLSTARSQVRAVFEKTGTRRQADLTRLIGLVAPARAPR